MFDEKGAAIRMQLHFQLSTTRNDVANWERSVQ